MTDAVNVPLELSTEEMGQIESIPLRTQRILLRVCGDVERLHRALDRLRIMGKIPPEVIEDALVAHCMDLRDIAQLFGLAAGYKKERQRTKSAKASAAACRGLNMKKAREIR